MVQNITKRLLRVDLTSRVISFEEMADHDIAKFLGGRVLGDIYLYRELPPGIDPLSPQNKLIFSTGPLTGTSAPGSSRYIVHSKSPQTGLYLSSLAGGYFGPELHKSGYEMLIIEGEADKPVYLQIRNDAVEIMDASELWGMNTDDTQKCIKESLNDTEVRIACIGPAGENLVLYAAIISERRAAGRGGAGAVMGSKKLKAIVVRGEREIPVANPEAFREAVKHAYHDISENHIISQAFPLYGSLTAMPALNEHGIIPWSNWQDASSPKGVKLFAQTWRDKYVKKDVRCAPPCNVKCSKLTMAEQGPHAGVLTEGPDYETEYSFGTCCDITDQAAIIEADALCDKHGLDTISMGVTIAFAMECYEKGIITYKDTGGLALKFGRADLLRKLIIDTAYKQNFGATLALGTMRMSEQFNHGSETFAMHAKGLELGGYDPRGATSVALVYACGSRGGCHKSGGSANAQSLQEIPTGDARFLNNGKAVLTKQFRENRVLADSCILCVFSQAAISNQTTLELLNAATGCNWSEEALHRISERGSNIERAFNIREGLRRSWDILPPRILKESTRSGPTRGHTVELETLLDNFYDICEWDRITGIPLPAKLRKLEMHEIATDMEVYLQRSK